jgi:DNA polymerase bacteriophage-type
MAVIENGGSVTTLWLDFETRSTLNIKYVGTDRYVRDDSTEVLMLAWAIDDGEVNIWVPIVGEPMPQALHKALIDKTVKKSAWNYGFERGVLAHRLGYQTDREEWHDPSVLAGYMSLPIGLDRASKALNLNESEKKIKTLGDDRLTKIFSQPSKRKKTELKKNPLLAPTYYRDWNTDPEKWQQFIDYCKNDVRAERAVWYAEVAMKCPMPYEEVKVWQLDQRMNDNGVYIDLVFVQNAADYAAVEVAGIIAEMKQLTGLENPNSTTHQLKPWLQARGYPFDSCAKEYIEEAVKESHRFKIQPLALEVLKLKQKLGGSAYTKLETILDRVSQDGRLRNQFLYHGAHTGRWSGRGVQLQNLFKPNERVNTVLNEVTEGIRTKTLDIPKIIADYNAKIDEYNKALNPFKGETPKKHLEPFTMMEAICGTIRSAFCAAPGNRLVMCDLAQIESRVLAALAGCQPMIDAYKSGADLYLDFMSWLLEKPLNKKEHKAERQRGKVVILGCGFGMGVDKFIEYAASFGVELTEKEAKEAVYGFREKYAEIPLFWKALDNAVKKAINHRCCVYVNGGIVVDGRNEVMLKIKLPNGRYLHYYKARIEQETTDYGVRDSVIYESWDAKGCQIKRLYGGLICENVVQAVARDVMVNGMYEAEKLGFIIVMTIHDELVCEVSIASGLNKKDLEGAMVKTPEWGEGMGFVLAAEGDENGYYRK